MPTSTPNIDAILADCYAIDPELKKHDAALREIVQKLLASKPDARPDAAFVARLREAVTQKAGTAPFGDRLRQLFTMRSPFPAGAAIAAIAVIAVVLSTKDGIKPGSIGDVTGLTKGPLAVADLGHGAFGSLVNANAGVAAGDQAISARAYGGGGGLGATSAVYPPATPMMAPMADGESAAQERDAASGNTAMSTDAKMIAPYPYEPINWRFTFDGELPAYDAELAVYRRVKGFGASLGSPNGLANVIGSVIDLSRFENATIQSFSVGEDREFGLIASVDAIEGMVSINQDWRRWPHPENLCRDEACWSRYRLDASQIPADDAIIAITDAFLADRGIDRGGYGAAEVRNDWRMGYAASSAMVKESYPAPETISVTYPQVLDDRTVVDEGGMTAGLSVNVNIRHMRVDGLWNLTGRAYERSLYAAETDTARVMKFVAQGGVWPSYIDPAAKTVDVALVAPEIVYLKTYKANENGMADELYVPALRFIVKTPPADQQWFRTSVVIPLAKESLDAADAQNGGVPTPMPYMMRGGEGSSGSSAGSVGSATISAPPAVGAPVPVE